MVYKKIVMVGLAVAVIACLMSNITFAAIDVTSNDKIYDGVMDTLIFIQKYSWPVMVLALIYAVYEFYIIGSEMLDHKIMGQRLLVGISVFMCLIQCMPLIYAFVLVATNA